NTLVRIYYGHLVSWKQKVSITTHVNSKSHIKNKKSYEITAQNKQFQTLENSISVAELKKTVVKDLVEAFVKQHIDNLKNAFQDKLVVIIVNKTTNSRARSIVNILFNYRNNTKLVVVNYLNSVNNTTMGQLIVKTLIEWLILFNCLCLLVYDSASYKEKLL
ncbi:6864_t:CDS:2, partial [Gigaspora margarita]